MNNNCKIIQDIMEGADLLLSMIKELTDGIKHLPGCKLTADLKELSANIGISSEGVYKAMRGIAADKETPYEKYSDAECEEAGNDLEADIPSGSDLREFLDGVASLLASGKPVSISADIYLNSADPESGEDA